MMPDQIAFEMKDKMGGMIFALASALRRVPDEEGYYDGPEESRAECVVRRADEVEEEWRHKLVGRKVVQAGWSHHPGVGSVRAFTCARESRIISMRRIEVWQRVARWAKYNRDKEAEMKGAKNDRR